MLLTIGMIVKNEERFIDRCLSSIKPILDNVDCELIITDTGSTDKTVEIAKQYTKNVLHFEWCNDFAAARNSGLKKAKGEWFMYLDADNIFTSCDGIIYFFNSGEYKNYNSATYISRNLSDYSGNYSDFRESRLTKIFPDTEFVGKIHEYLTHFTYPIKNIPDVALHYGYLFESSEQSKAKAERNLKLLLESYDENDIKNPLIFKQIYDAYCMKDDRENGDAYLNKGIEYCRKTHSLYAATYYCCKLYEAFRNDEITEIERLFEKYSEWKRSINADQLTTDVEIYAIYGDSLRTHLNFSGAMNTLSVYFNIYDKVKTGELNTDDASALNLRVATDRNYIDFVTEYLSCCIKCGEYSKANDFIVSKKISGYPVKKSDTAAYLAEEIVVIEENVSYIDAYTIYGNLNEETQKYLIGDLISKLYASEKKEIILNVLIQIGKDVEWLGKKAEIYRNYFIENKADEFQLERYVILYGIMKNIDLIAVAMNTQIDISIMFSAIDIDIQKCAYLCCKKFAGFYDVAENYRAESVISDRHLSDVLKFYEYCISVKLIENEDKTSEEKEQLVARLFRIKTAIKKRLDRVEFDKMTVSVKQNIRNSISSGNYEQAKKTLEDYKQINPKDVEIGELEAMLQGK